jgi:hypothetical protein
VESGPNSAVVRLAVARDDELWRQSLAGRLAATYSTVTTTGWGINADGRTYGVQNKDGMPDLLAAIATNGASGYVYSDELQRADASGLPTTPSEAVNGHRHVATTIAVYESDGRTVVGEFVVR